MICFLDVKSSGNLVKSDRIIEVKVKQSHYRSGPDQRVLRKLKFPDFVTTAQDDGRL